MENPTCSNYVIAGAKTLAQLMGNFIKSNNGEYISKEKFSNFLQGSVNKFLVSFGIGVDYKNKTLTEKQVNRFLKELNYIIEKDFMKGSEIYWDSGGFQVAQGAFNTEDIPRFNDMYYKTIVDHSDKCNYAFIQDIPPGPGSEEIFSSYDQIEELNRLSYQKCIDIVPEETRKNKMIYIHHFRTPSLFDIWKKLTFDEDLANGYTYFGTGGIVANLADDLRIPIILYAIPLGSIVAYAKNKGMTKFKFHILGGANLIDVFYHKLFEHHVYKQHGIEVEITYDSSALFKALAIARYIHVKTPSGYYEKLDFRSDRIDKRFNGMLTSDWLYSLFNDVADRYDFKKLTSESDPIYIPNTNTRVNSSMVLNRSVLLYTMCYSMDLYRVIEQEASDFAKHAYEAYEANDIVSFNNIVRDRLVKMNQGKATKKPLQKASCIKRSLDLLNDLDIDKYGHYVGKYLGKDDIDNLKGGFNSVPTF